MFGDKNTIKHCLVTNLFSGWTPFWSCLIEFERRQTFDQILQKTFCSFKHVWYGLTAQYNITMFGHQRMFDRVSSPNLSRLDRASGGSRPWAKAGGWVGRVGVSRPWAKGESPIVFCLPCRLFFLLWFFFFFTHNKGGLTPPGPSPRSATANFLMKIKGKKFYGMSYLRWHTHNISLWLIED